MNRTLQVFVGDDTQQVGTLRYEAQGRRERASFEYDPVWIARGFALEPGLPLVRGPQFYRPIEGGSVFPGVIADTEPDGWGQRVIRREQAKRRAAAKRRGAATAPVLQAVDYLLAVDDQSRVGALRYRDETGIFQQAAEAGRRTVPPLVELGALLKASRRVEANRETLADLAFLRGRGTSLGGMRPKCTVVDADGHLAIGKFPSKSDERAVTKGEVLALKLAQAAGINAAEARLVDSDGQAVALVRRFDRTGGHKRIHYVSAATLMGVPRGDPGENAYTEMVDAIRRHGAAVQEDVEELWRRMAFSVLVNNVDDHLHNHGFLHAGSGLWRLAPAFDLNPFPGSVRELKTWISEDAGPAASVEALLSVIAYFRITRSRARVVLREVEGAVANWRVAGRELGMRKMELEQFADAFENEERAVARRG